MENTDVTRFGDQMAHEEWIKTLKDGRKVKFIYQELPDDGALRSEGSAMSLIKSSSRAIYDPIFLNGI
jgi:hypothetical protein